MSVFFNDTATTEIYTLSLHDALPICLGVAPLEVTDHPVELGHVLAAAPVTVTVGDVDPAPVRPVEDQVPVLLEELAPRRVEVYAVLLGERRKHTAVVLRLRVGPGDDGAVVYAEVP